jgi:outer membrane lipoprotein carrier protein
MSLGRTIERGSRTILAAALLFACIDFSLRAQQRSPYSAQDDAPGYEREAKELAQRVDRHYNMLQSLRAGFTESYEGMGMRRTESGTLLMLKPGRMKWEYSAPYGKLFLLDGQYAWFYTRGDPQVQRIPSKQLDDLRSPLRFLLGHTELAKELNGLTLRPIANGLYILSGQPKGMENRVDRLSLTVTADGTIVGIEIEEVDGALTHFTFTGEQPNPAIPAETFRFVPPYGIPIVDALPPV